MNCDKVQYYTYLANVYCKAAEENRNLADRRWEELKRLAIAFEEVSRMAAQQVPGFYNQWVAHYWDEEPPIIPEDALKEALGIREN